MKITAKEKPPGRNFEYEIPNKTYILELSSFEAAVLYRVSQVTGGSPSGPRRVLDDIGNGLRILGVKEPNQFSIEAARGFVLEGKGPR